MCMLRINIVDDKKLPIEDSVGKVLPTLQEKVNKQRLKVYYVMCF